MHNLKPLGWCLVAMVAACGSEDRLPASNSHFMAGFAPAAVQPGYTRFISPPILGGEGMAKDLAGLPEGLFFRLRKGLSKGRFTVDPGETAS